MFAATATKDKSGLPSNPRELLKALRSVSKEAIEDFNRGMILGRVEKLGHLMKFSCWGLYPKAELEELTTVALVFLMYYDNLDKEPKIKKVEVPEYVKQQNMARSKGMYQALSK